MLAFTGSECYNETRAFWETRYQCVIMPKWREPQ